jgi:prepilin-type N-terminal cleavage/methylation domain-containing protein
MRNLRPKNRKGFTLIELLISIVIFVILLGSIATSYVSIVRAQKEANDVRRMYSDVRHFVDELSEEVRLGTIDYEYYGDVTLYSSSCYGQFSNIVSGRSNDLALVRKDGLQKTIFHYDSDKNKVQVIKCVKGAGGTWPLAPGFENGFSDAMGNTVQVENISFAINPDVNPYSSDNYYKNEKQFQPKVTVFMNVKNGANTNSQFSMDFQTTVSSRVYSRL